MNLARQSTAQGLRLRQSPLITIDFHVRLGCDVENDRFYCSCWTALCIFFILSTNMVASKRHEAWPPRLFLVNILPDQPLQTKQAAAGYDFEITNVSCQPNLYLFYRRRRLSITVSLAIHMELDEDQCVLAHCTCGI